MDKSQEDKLTMFINIRTVCLKHSDAVAATAAFSPALTRLDRVISDISSAYGSQTVNTTGITGIKTNTRADMQNQTMKVRGLVYTYAFQIKDLPMQGRTKFAKSVLDRARDTQIATLCRKVYAEALAIAENLVPFGLQGNQLKDLDNAIKAYEASLGTPELAKGEKKLATQSLKSLLDDGSSLLENEMDNMVDNMEDSFPLFFKEYYAARAIVTRGVQSSKPADPTPPTPPTGGG